MHRNQEEGIELFGDSESESQVESVGLQPEVSDQDSTQKSKAETSSQKEPVFQIRLSRALHKKLLSKAQMEGVSPQDLARELLSEGLVLRAWEIVERKNTMRSSSQGNNFSQNSNNGRNQGKTGYRNNHSQGSSNGYNRNRQNNYSNNSSSNHNRRGNFNHILEDSANFMEYVRNQEKKNN